MSLRRAETLQDALQRTSGRSSGFDYLRLGLAVLIICLHGGIASYGAGAQDRFLATPQGRPFLLLVPMFFSLSGFLVAGSWERCRTIFAFLGLRVLRIFPALSVQVVLSALVIGPLFTAYSLGAYFGDPLFIRFFWNAVGHTQYALPGVFTHNPDTAVNGQLWTVPYELDCYVILAGLALVGVLRRRGLFLAGLAGVQGLLVVHALFRPHGLTLPLSGQLIGLCFMWGLALYRFRDRVSWSGAWASLALAVSLAGLMIPNGKYFVTLPIAYFTVWLGLLNPPRHWLVRSGDYSYGLYVFGYPVQQALATFPELRIWWLNILLGLPCAFAVAFVSWHLIEKRALAQRGRLMDLEALLIRSSRRLAHWRPGQSRLDRQSHKSGLAAAEAPKAGVS